jgi:hypothetical protein
MDATQGVNIHIMEARPGQPPPRERFVAAHGDETETVAASSFGDRFRFEEIGVRTIRRVHHAIHYRSVFSLKLRLQFRACGVSKVGFTLSDGGRTWRTFLQ